MLWGRWVIMSSHRQILAMKEEVMTPEPEVDCPVCWNPYDNSFHTPKLLECKHTFCLECLVRMRLVSEMVTGLACPLCRQYTMLDSNVSITDIPTNSSIMNRLRLEPHHIVLEGGQLSYKDSRKFLFFLRQPTVYTLSLGTGLSRSHNHPAAIHRLNTIQKCCRSRQFRSFVYVMVTMFCVTVLLIISLFWTHQLLWKQ